MSPTVKHIVLLIAAILVAIPCVAQGGRPTLPAVEVAVAPIIDGDLSDECWKQAPSVSNFFWEGDASKAKEPTTAWICYDQTNIYFAFDCKDSQPDKIRIQQTKRGGSLNADDWVGINLDCYCNGQKIVWFDVSAGGVQVENTQTGDVSKIEWRGDWNAAARRNSDGYTTEFAIPFSILQYDDRKTSMGLAFIRRHMRYDEWWISPATGTDHDFRKFYLWDGLKLPRFRVNPLLLGYSLIKAGSGMSGQEFGLDAKYPITPSVRGTMTLHPDFGSVEQGVTGVDFSYVEKKETDSRPFFQEGRGYFPGDSVFYSRRIEEMDFGGKIAGELGNCAIGLMHGGQFGKSRFDVLKVSRDWAGKGGFTLSGAQLDASGAVDSIGRLQTYYRLHEHDRQKVDISLDGGIADPSTGTGRGYMNTIAMSSFGRPRVIGWSISRQSIDPNYNPSMAYIAESGIVTNWLSFNLGDQPATGRFKGWGADFSLGLTDHSDGSLYHKDIGAGFHYDLRNGCGGYSGVSYSDRPPYHDRQITSHFFWGSTDMFRRGEIELSIGNQAGGDYLYYSLTQGWNFGSKLSMSFTYGHSSISEPSPDEYAASQFVASFNYDIDPQQSLVSRLVHAGGQNNVYAAYRRRVRAGVDGYIIFGDPNAEKTTTAITIKLLRPIGF